MMDGEMTLKKLKLKKKKEEEEEEEEEMCLIRILLWLKVWVNLIFNIQASYWWNQAVH